MFLRFPQYFETILLSIAAQSVYVDTRILPLDKSIYFLYVIYILARWVYLQTSLAGQGSSELRFTSSVATRTQLT